MIKKTDNIIPHSVAKRKERAAKRIYSPEMRQFEQIVSLAFKRGIKADEADLSKLIQAIRKEV